VAPSLRLGSEANGAQSVAVRHWRQLDSCRAQHLSQSILVGTTGMGSEPRDLGALEKAVNDAAGRASNLWISFVFFATLIAITTGTVTHKHLFLELPLKLPVLNVDLPLMGYFFAVPLFFVVERGLLHNGRLQAMRYQLHDIAARMREARTDASKCAGVRGFLDADWEWLDELVKEAPPKPGAAQSSSGK
jgi:hypothetical protein